MKSYKVMRTRAELGFVDYEGRNKAGEMPESGCTFDRDPDPELVAEFETLESAREELAK